jgi:uncharacterized cupredoxin-like copper-binding protein
MMIVSRKGSIVLRRIVTITAIALLSMIVLAACGNGDDDDAATDEVDDTTEVIDDAAVEDEEETDDQGAARTDDGDAAGQTGGSPADDEAELMSEQLDVTLIDHEIEMEQTASAGIVAFIISNEGEEEHGISIAPANGADEDVLGTMYVEPGGDEQLELELEAGEYVVFCPVDDHREEHGMETTLTVE